jgi:hypothetical protein
MDNPAPLDIDALEREIDALLVEDAAMEARVSALLARTSSPAALIADCQVMARYLERDSRVQARYQRRIQKALDA